MGRGYLAIFDGAVLRDEVMTASERLVEIDRKLWGGVVLYTLMIG